MNVFFDDLMITHTGLQVVEHTDYYPYGMVMRKELPPQGQGIYNPYRFGYQGQFAEKDDETRWNHFELRQYDSRIGRWTATDPYRQFYSPYNGMGNNPINGVDPDGGFSRIGAWWRSRLIPNAYIYNVDGKKEWAVGWSEWKSDDHGAYMRYYSITEGGPGLRKYNPEVSVNISFGLQGGVSMGPLDLDANALSFKLIGLSNYRNSQEARVLGYDFGQMKYNPKLIAQTSASAGAIVSSIAYENSFEITGYHSENTITYLRIEEKVHNHVMFIHGTTENIRTGKFEEYNDGFVIGAALGLGIEIKIR